MGCLVIKPVAMSGPPLMHGTGCWLGLMFPHMLGGTSVLLENRGFKPEEVWSTVERDRISQIIIILKNDNWL